MFKSARWRSENNNKFKAVYRLQFHATQVTQLGQHSLMISIVPAGVGKPTSILEKVKAQDGSCYWEKPVYETVNFTREPETGKINERIYYFIIATGLSKFGLLGEVSIDFASYAMATKISSLSLPLKAAKFEAVLHVSIERVQASGNQREIEEGENLKHNPEDKSLRAQLSNSNIDGTEDPSFNKLISHVAGLNETHRASIGSDITISSSESSSGLDKSLELSMKNNIMNEEESHGSQTEWSGGSAPNVSTEDSSSSPCETLITERSREPSDILIENLKTELSLLSRQLEVSDLELQTLRKNIVKECKRGQDLAQELVSIKEERDAFKEELEKRADELKVRNKLQIEGGDPRGLVEELRKELSHEKNLNANLHLQLQKTQELNSELIFAVRDLEEMLEEKNREILDISNKSARSEHAKSEYDTDVDEDQRALEDLVKEHIDTKDAYLLEQKIRDLYGEVEIYKRDKDDLEMQIEQLALDYEILKQENHDISYKLEQSEMQEQVKMQYECSTSYATLSDLEGQIENLENEIKKKSREFSESLITITELENHVKSLEEEIEKQSQVFEVDLEDLTRAKVEQEQRAIRAEEALRKTRWQNGKMAERLQVELRRCYAQMASTFDANEKKPLTKTLTESNELHLEKNYLEEMLQQAKEEIGNQRRHADEIQSLISQEILVLQSEIGRLKMENNVLSEQEKQKENLRAELEEMMYSIKETEMLVERGITERKEFENTRTLREMESEKLLKELNIMRSLKDEAESRAGNLQSEVVNLKEKIRLLEVYKYAENSALTDGVTEEPIFIDENLSAIECQRTLKKSYNDTSSENEPKDSAADSRCQGCLNELLNEMGLLKERNQLKEVELKDMQERYSEISLKFAEVEGQRQQLVITLRNVKNSIRS